MDASSAPRAHRLLNTGRTLNGAHSRGLGKSTRTRKPHCGPKRGRLTPRKTPRAPLSLRNAGDHPSFYRLHTFAFSRRSSGWNHRVGKTFGPAPPLEEYALTFPSRLPVLWGLSYSSPWVDCSASCACTPVYARSPARLPGPGRVFPALANQTVCPAHQTLPLGLCAKGPCISRSGRALIEHRVPCITLFARQEPLSTPWPLDAWTVFPPAGSLDPDRHNRPGVTSPGDGLAASSSLLKRVFGIREGSRPHRGPHCRL